MKHLDFINQKLHQINETKTQIHNVDKAMVDQYKVFAKQIKPLPSAPHYQIPSIRKQEKW